MAAVLERTEVQLSQEIEKGSDVDIATAAANAEQSDTGTAVARAFHTAILLTGSKKLAERAVAEAIRLWDYSEPLQRALSLGSMKASIPLQSSSEAGDPEELEAAAATLPPALRHVPRLASDLRNCFVMRILIGLAEDECARQLGFSASQVADYLCAATYKLCAFESDGRARDL